ncbi:MAG: hypothetical protein AAF968_07640 [Pseudomonadota bacterium]
MSFLRNAAAIAAAIVIGVCSQAHALIVVDPGPVGVAASGRIDLPSIPFSETIPSPGTLTGQDDIAFSGNKFIRYTGTGLNTTVEFLLSDATTITFSTPLGSFQDISLVDMMGDTISPDTDGVSSGSTSFQLFADRTLAPGTTIDIFGLNFLFNVSASSSVDIESIAVSFLDTDELGRLEILEKTEVPVPMSLPFLLAGLAGLRWMAHRSSAEA